MKKFIYLLLPILMGTCFLTDACAQAPKVIPYQGVARDAGGAVVPNRAISLRFRIRDVSAVGAVLYEETQSITTNVLGSFTANIGMGAVTAGSMTAILWGVNAKYLQVEMDINGGSVYIDMGARQLFSVPYALFSGSTPGWFTSGSSVILDSDFSKVGIGVNSPSFKLDVGDRMRLRTSTLGSIYNTPGIWLDDYRNGNTNVFFGMQDSIRLGIYGGTGLGYGFNFNTNSGNANIGSLLGDSYRLTLSGNDNGIALYNSSNSYYGNFSTNSTRDLVLSSAYSSGLLPFPPYYYPAKNILLNPPPYSNFSNQYPGNVGINVDSPTARLHVDGDLMVGSGKPATGYKLSVNGKIIAEEVKVQLKTYWPDYVFEKNYQLPDLRYLKSYIETNKHLPNIPAAKEVEKNGLLLGDMQTRMMEKIEELTLYIIDLQKQIDELKSQNKD